MITLDDCLAFCETPPVVVERIAEQESLPLVLACAYARQNMLGASDTDIGEAYAPVEPPRLAA